MKVTTGDLWNKYLKSGLNGNPIISNKELSLLKERLEDMAEFMREYNGLVWALKHTAESIHHMLEERKR